MKEKKFILSLMFALGILFSMSFVLGAITFNTPSTAGDTVTGTYLFNITTLIMGGDCNWSTTSNGVFNNTDNSTATQVIHNFTYDTTQLTDAEDTILTVNCTNATASEQSTLTINVDNANPVCGFTVNREIVEVNDILGIETTQSSTDTTDLTYAWVLYRSDNTQSTTSSLSAPTFSGTDFDQPDEFIMALTVTDEASLSTTCTNLSILVQGSEDSGDDILTTPLLESIFTSRTRIILIIIGAVVLMGVVALVLILMIDKTKRRNR